MKRSRVLVLIAIVVVAIVAVFIVYSNWFAFRGGEQIAKASLKPVSLKIMTTWSQWSYDDFKRYFFAESGMPRTGVILPPAAMVLNITNITFLYVEDPKVWKEAGLNGSVDGFIGQNRYNITMLCREGALHSIDDPAIVNLSNNIPNSLKGYTSDGKLCWVAIYFVPYAWLVNTNYASKMGLQIPNSWSDLIKPDYVAIITKGGYLMAVYPVPNRAPMVNTINTILAKYGWEKGWSIIAVIMGAASKLETSSKAASDSVSFGKALLTILEFGDAYTAYSMFPDRLQIVFPKNETGYWFVPIAIAANVSKDGLDGMYRLIKWALTDMQDKMLLNRSGWTNNMPVLGFNNTSPRMKYKNAAIENLFAPSPDIDFALGEAAPAVNIYADLIVSDKDVRSLLNKIVANLINKYLNNQISLDDYYHYIDMLGQPPEIIDPISGSKTAFTLDEARILGNAIRSGTVNASDLRNALKSAMISKLTSLLQAIS